MDIKKNSTALLEQVEEKHGNDFAIELLHEILLADTKHANLSLKILKTVNTL